MVCGLQHKATHERTAPAATTINLRHRWAIRRKNTSWNVVETGSPVCLVKRWMLCKEERVQSNWNLSILKVKNRRNWNFCHSASHQIHKNLSLSAADFLIFCISCPIFVKPLHKGWWGDFWEKWVGGLMYSSRPGVLFSCIFTSPSAKNRPQSRQSADRKLALIHFSQLFSCSAGRTKSWTDNQAERERTGLWRRRTSTITSVWLSDAGARITINLATTNSSLRVHDVGESRGDGNQSSSS